MVICGRLRYLDMRASRFLRKNKSFLLLLLFLSGIHFLYAALSAVPMVFPDEGGYLLNAAALAGFKTDGASDYHAGYSLLITPAFLLGKNGGSVYFFVKVINTALFSGMLF